jgi:phosphate transport system protein
VRVGGYAGADQTRADDSTGMILFKKQPRSADGTPNMSEHTVKAFTEQLESLATAVAQMGGLAEAQLADAIEAIAKRDTGLAEAAIAGDPRIDALQQTIEDQALKLLALRQPMAIDLRETLAAIKIASELERVGDLAKNIAKRALVLNREPPIRLTQSLARMGRSAQQQLKGVLDSYSDRDAAGAEAVWRNDGEIDEIYNSLFRELLTYMMEDPRTIGLCTHLLFVAKNMERTGDHATNIAETVYYMVTGGHLTMERPKADVTSSTTVKFERPST